MKKKLRHSAIQVVRMTGLPKQFKCIVKVNPDWLEVKQTVNEREVN
ncbi:hypothetical protein PI126_g14779 [Phytophthora idaei]|nr:hypothetical protein PI126_g14779 [Phytophthora idaei]